MSSFLSILRQMTGGKNYNSKLLEGIFEILDEDDISPSEVKDEIPLQIYNLVTEGKIYVADTHNDCGVPFQAFGMFAFDDKHCINVYMNYPKMSVEMDKSRWCDELEVDFSKFVTVEEGTVEALKQEAFKDVSPVTEDDEMGMKIWSLINAGNLCADTIMSVSGVVKYKDGYLLLLDS